MSWLGQMMRLLVQTGLGLCRCVTLLLLVFTFAHAQDLTSLQGVYENGQLSVFAENATLREILDAVHTQTGAKIEGLAIDDSTRISAHLGPGELRTVLGDLVYGTGFNLFITTSLESPGKINRIVLTRRLPGPTPGHFPVLKEIKE